MKRSPSAADEAAGPGFAVKTPDPAPPAPRRLADRPAVAWLLENGCILGLALLHWLLIRPKARSPEPRGRLRFFLKETLRSVAGGLILIEGSILAQKVLAEKVYAHIPYFTPAAQALSKASLREWLRDWCTCNLPSHFTSSATVNLMLVAHSLGGTATPRARRTGPLKFLFKLAVARATADLAFYGVHRALHTKWLYGSLHKKHHEHKAPALITNCHFTIADLYIEGFLPLFAAMVALGHPSLIPTPFENVLVVLYVQWYEIGSHAGKALPTVTYFPPLAPLYRHFLGDVDARNVEFHHVHHAKLDCNYGITQWVDHLLGTAKLPALEAEKKL